MVVLFGEIDEEFAATEYLLNAVVVPVFEVEVVDLGESAGDHDHNAGPLLGEVDPTVADLQKLPDLLFYVRDELEFHLVLEVEDAPAPLGTYCLL